MSSLIKSLLSYLKKLEAFLQSKVGQDTQEQLPPINSLAPKILTEEADLERVKPYLNNLKDAIDAPGINNIAIAGSYGSGKSTLLRTFENQYPQYKCLNISLASFKDNKGDKNDESFERRVEVSILQQMFYHVKPSVIPDSRYKRIVNITTRKLFWHTVFLIVWILSALALLKFGYLEKLNPNKWRISYAFDWLAFFFSLVFFTGIGLFVKSVYRLLSNSKISKLNIKGEFELGEAIDKSVFNQHLEEILYFFERTEFNVVVIEDVDRFDSTDIFTKLREINVLINNSNLIKRPVKFVYAIKDEMFTDKNDRVKFFEFIIPIIPFINPSNANDQLSKLITNANLEGTLSSEFTADVVTFIDDIDMRLLINIFQEYRIYSSVLSPSLEQDNLFAILVYKNMYPDDFSELSKRRGKLYKFLTNKQTYIKALRENFDLEIKRLENRINLLENEATTSVKELRAVYVSRLVSRLPNFQSFSLVGKTVSMLEAVEDEFFNQIITASKISYVKYEHHYSTQYYLHTTESSGIKFSAIEKEISKELTYEERERLLQERADNQINILKSEREIVQNKLVELESFSIQEIFELVDITEHLGEFKDSYLMRNLLLNGYIDEHFEDYISLFHEVSLTKDDFSFERNVKSGVAFPFNYPLSKTENLIKRLPEKYFKREAILNFSILESLLDNDSKYQVKMNNFFKGLCIDGEKQFHFIHGYVNNGSKHIAAFFRKLCAFKPELWRYINAKSGLPDSSVRNLVTLIFEYADLSAILRFKDVDSLVKYLEQLPDFFAFSAAFRNIKTIQGFISTQKLKFVNLDLPAAGQNQLFTFIYTGNYYQINEHNIKAIIQGNKAEFDAKKLAQLHLTTISKLDLKSLKDYINANLEQYINNVMLLLKNNTQEEEGTIINILNRSDVKLSLKESILGSQDVVVQSLSNIEEVDVQQLALSNNSVMPSWENVFAYYDAVEGDDLDGVLIGFLNDANNYMVLSKKKLNGISGKEVDYIKGVSDKLLHSQKLTLEAYTALLASLPYVYGNIRYKELDTKRISSLLDRKMLTLSTANFNGLKAKSDHLSTRLIEIYQNEFVKNFSDLPLEDSDWVQVFSSSEVTQENKLLLLQEMDDSLIINNHVLAEAICNLLPLDKYIPLRYEVMEAMFKVNQSVQRRIKLLNLYFASFEDDQIQSLTEKLGESYAKVFMKQHKPVFPFTDFNIAFFNNLKERNLIIRYELEDEGRSIRVFAKYQ